MSGVTSTIHDSGRVYLFDRNALPKNFIESGMKLSTSGLTATVSTGTCDISGKFHEFASPASIDIPQRMTCLLYAAKSDLTDTPTLGYIQAAFPAADSGTVCRWIIDGSATISSTVGSNNLTRNGTVTQVDGWIGYGGQGDGNTGYYVSANSTGFPTGANFVEMTWGGVIKSISTPQMLFHYGGGTTGTGHALWVYGGKFAINPGATVDTGIAPSENGRYYITLQYDGTSYKLYLNGSLVYVGAATMNITAGNLYLLSRSDGSYRSPSIVDYFDISSALRTAAPIAAISNALLLPCRYYMSETENIYTDVRAVLPANTISLGRIRTSSTAITEASMDYQDGRREGAVGGNRRVFLGWRYVANTNAIHLDYPNPFATENIQLTLYYTPFIGSAKRVLLVDHTASYYEGYQQYMFPDRISLVTKGGYGIYYNDDALAWVTSGYIGCYAEVIE